MIHFLADESVDFRIVIRLREEGFVLDSIIEIGPGVDDVEVMFLANTRNAILITEDKDFGELTYRLKKQNKGIILLRLIGLSIDEKILKIKGVFDGHFNSLTGKFIVITNDKVRIKEQ